MTDVIFDLDGTLIDSHECIFVIYEKLFTELGIQFPPLETMYTYIGPSVETVMGKYLPPEEAPKACARFRALYEQVDLTKTNRLYDGVKEMLRTLQQDGYRLFIASTKNEHKANLIPGLLGIKNYFTGIFGSRDEIGRTTKRQVLDDLCKAYTIDKKNALLIGDTHYDAEGAKQAGIDVVIVEYGFGDLPKIKKEYDVAYFAKTPGDVVEYVRNRT